MKRSEAKVLGLKQYYTGVPCKFGHLDYRYTSSGTCCGCNLRNSRNSQWEKQKKLTKLRVSANHFTKSVIVKNSVQNYRYLFDMAQLFLQLYNVEYLKLRLNSSKPCENATFVVPRRNVKDFIEYANGIPNGDIS